MLLILNACTKETESLETPQTPVSTETDMALQIKEYYPSEEVDVTEKVLGFFNHTKTHNPEASFKMEFEDMEVNEAMWTLEAASNYLVNKNLKYRRDLNDNEISFKIILSIENNKQILGKKLVEEFERLHYEINRICSSKGRIPQLIDYRLSKASNDEVTFNITVLIGTNVLLKNDSYQDLSRPEKCPTNGIYKVGHYCFTQNIPTHGETSVNEVATNVINCLDDTGWNGNYYYTSLSPSTTTLGPKTAFFGHHSFDGSDITVGGQAFREFLNEDICAFNTINNVFQQGDPPLSGKHFAKVSSSIVDTGNSIQWTVDLAWIGKRIYY